MNLKSIFLRTNQCECKCESESEEKVRECSFELSRSHSHSRSFSVPGMVKSRNLVSGMFLFLNLYLQLRMLSESKWQ